MMCASASGPVSFLTLRPGTPVVDRFGAPVGSVARVLVLEGDEFDGIVVETSVGRRFVDAPEVRRISAGAVTLGIALADVDCPSDGRPRSYGVPEARYDRVDATEADRDEAIDRLKRAYVEDAITVEQLGERVSIAHCAETLEQLDQAVAGLDDE
jgi:hypothetical protein